MYEWIELILESLYFLNKYLKTLGWLEVYIEWPILHEVHCLLFSLTKNVQGSSKHVKINISNCLADAPRYPPQSSNIEQKLCTYRNETFHSPKVNSQRHGQDLQIYIGLLLHLQQQMRIYAWLAQQNILLEHSVSLSSKSHNGENLNVVNFHIKPGCMWGIEGETRTDILTKACKFSNFFIELACLGSDVCGQGDTIIASFRWGSACYESKKIRNPSRKLVPYSSYTGEKW